MELEFCRLGFGHTPSINQFDGHFSPLISKWGLLGRINEIVFVIMPNIYIIACAINVQSAVTPSRLDVLEASS